MSVLSGSLLQVIVSEPSDNQEKRIPLMMDFPVNRLLSPFLVSSTKAVLWISRTPQDRVRAATRKIASLEAYFIETVEAIILKGREMGWGNIQPLSRGGLEAAIAHLVYYDLTAVEILANPKFVWSTLDPEWEPGSDTMVLAILGLPVQPAVWVPLDTLLVVPKDRGFLGFVFLIRDRIASVIHNASRGIGIVTSKSS